MSKKAARRISPEAQEKLRWCCGLIAKLDEAVLLEVKLL